VSSEYIARGVPCEERNNWGEGFGQWIDGRKSARRLEEEGGPNGWTHGVSHT
jgi:hypothetical protein